MIGLPLNIGIFFTTYFINILTSTIAQVYYLSNFAIIIRPTMKVGCPTIYKATIQSIETATGHGTKITKTLLLVMIND